jgi:hypothetical protein
VSVPRILAGVARMVCLVVIALTERGALHAAGGDELAESILRRVPAADAKAARPPSVETFARLAITSEWTEIWPNADGKDTARQVKGTIWNAAIEAALAKENAVYLPKRAEPYYLDGPIVLKSGQRLFADRDAEVRLKPGTNTCMIRNEHIVSGAQGPVSVEVPADTDITIDGGIWTTLHTSNAQNNGNDGGRAAKTGGVAGCHGLVLLSNVRRFQVRNVTIRQTKAFGLHLSNCAEFVVENITFEDHGRDGVHVNGPASFGVIRQVRGLTKDDFVALNAWDWRGSTPTFGAIHDVLVEHVDGAEAPSKATEEIRLLPGVKRFADGSVIDCPIQDVVLRDFTNIRGFKLYDQPNLEAARDNDFSVAPGKLRNLYFERLVFHRPSRMEIADDVDGLAIDDVKFDYPGAESRPFVEIGPMSMTYKLVANDPAKWVELFSPDQDVTVRHFSLTHAQALRDGSLAPVEDAMTRLVKVASQRQNPDYPRTLPRGGTGKAIFLP